MDAMFGLTVRCSIDACTKDVLPVKCPKCDSTFCNDHYKNDLTHNCMMSDTKCLNCGVRIDSVNDTAVARLNQEKAIFKQQENSFKAKIQSLEKKLFDLNQDLVEARNDSIRFQEMREENMSLSKDVIVLGEMCNRAQEKLEAMNSNHFLRSSQISDRTKIKTMERELDRERQTADNRTRERDWFRGRCSELEDILGKKEAVIADLRKQMECHQIENKAKLDAKTERIKVLEIIKKQMTDIIFDLNQKLGIRPIEPLRSNLDHENGSDQDNDVNVDSS